MSESMQHNIEIHIIDNSDHDQRSGEQASCNMPPNFHEMFPTPPELANNIGTQTIS